MNTELTTTDWRLTNGNMQLFRGTLLLFGLNLLDALLTIVWVRSGVAGEGNHLMSQLLDIGDFTFLAAKIGIGLITAVVLLRFGNRKLARYGLTVALAVYLGLMGIHIFTGLAAVGLISHSQVQDVTGSIATMIGFII